MIWLLIAYAVAGFLLALWICSEEHCGQLTTNDWLIAVLFGWLVGVPATVILLVCFGNWPVILRDVRRAVAWPFCEASAAIRQLAMKE